MGYSSGAAGGPSYLGRSDTLVQAQNTIAETDLVNYAVGSGVWAKAKRWQLRVGGLLMNNTAGPVTFLWRLKIDATTILATAAISIAQNANQRKWTSRFTFVQQSDVVPEPTIIEASGFILVSTATADTMAPLDAAVSVIGTTNSGITVPDMSDGFNLSLTMQMGTASASAFCRHFESELLDFG